MWCAGNSLTADPRTDAAAADLRRQHVALQVQRRVQLHPRLRHVVHAFHSLRAAEVA